MTRLNLDDSSVGYGHRSMSDLYKHCMLFGLMKFPGFVKLGPFALDFALKARLPVRGLVKSMLFDTFCGGENIAQTQTLITTLASKKVGSILDFAVEGTCGGDLIAQTEKETLANIQLAEKNRAIAACVLKFSGIASLALTTKKSAGISLTAPEQQEWLSAQGRLDALCGKAASAGVTLMMDAEESWLQGAIDEALLTMMAKYNSSTAVVYTTLQMYRHDRLNYLYELYEKARQGGFHIGIKLVRGAYLEKENSRAFEMGTPSPIYGSKKETDHAYDAALEFCASHIDRIHLCAGTHNSSSTQKLAQLMAQYQIAPEDKRVGFAQLLGMGDILTYNLAASGYNTAKYIPYGPLPSLVPYLSRRMEENSAMRGQTATELGLIHAEIKRRKKM